MPCQRTLHNQRHSSLLALKDMVMQAIKKCDTPIPSNLKKKITMRKKCDTFLWQTASVLHVKNVSKIQQSKCKTTMTFRHLCLSKRPFTKNLFLHSIALLFHCFLFAKETCFVSFDMSFYKHSAQIWSVTFKNCNSRRPALHFIPLSCVSHFLNTNMHSVWMPLKCLRALHYNCYLLQTLSGTQCQYKIHKQFESLNSFHVFLIHLFWLFVFLLLKRLHLL